MYKAGLGTKKRSERLISLALALLVVAGGITGAWLHWHHTAAQTTANTSPVPKNVAQAVNFPVYYPDPQKLPAGYTLNANSFTSPVKNGVTYSVSYDSGKKIVFSIQVKPADSELQTFNSSYIPLRIDYQTPIGQAEIGAYHSQTLVSLPITNGPWVIITAPPDINQSQLKQVIKVLRQ